MPEVIPWHDLPGRYAGRCPTCNEAILTRARTCTCQDTPHGCHQVRRQFNPQCPLHRSVYVYARVKRDADTWAREQGIRPRHCYTHGSSGGWSHYRDDAGHRHWTMPAAGNRVVVLGEVGKTIESILRVAQRRHPDLQIERIPA